MEKILNKKFAMNPLYRAAVLALVTVLAVLSVVVYNNLFTKIQTIVMQDAEENVLNIASLNTEVLRRELENRMTVMESFAGNLSVSSTTTPEMVAARMAHYVERYNFEDIAVLAANGTLHTTSGQMADVGFTSPYREALRGEAMISKTFPSVTSGELVNLFSVPVNINGKFTYVLTATYPSANLAKLVDTSALAGKDYVYLVDADANAVFYPVGLEDETGLGLLAYVAENEEISPAANNHAAFTYAGTSYHAYFVPLGINDWYLMTCATEAAVFDTANEIMYGVLAGMGYLWVLLLAAVVVIILLVIRFQSQIRNIVFNDPLLQEKNYTYFQVNFPQLVGERPESRALFVLDIDHFKDFNYIYSSDRGDDLLRYLNRIFHEELPDDQIYRHSADLFCGLLRCQNTATVQQKMDRLLMRITRDVDATIIPAFGISIGVRMLSAQDDMQTAYNDAMVAKHAVKNNRLQKFALYNDGMRLERAESQRMRREFDLALSDGEFEVYYQPKVDMRSGRVTGSEALVRWIRQDGYVLLPGVFLPCLEESRQVIKLDEAVLGIVCRQIRAMQEDGLDIVPVSVNLSVVHLKHPTMADRLCDIVKKSGADPTKVVFEIPESALYEDNIPLHMIVDKLHAIGCRIEMDDYGAGAAGPGSLAEVLFDTVKLDKRYVERIGDARREAVVHATIALAKELGMTVIAEGVETQEQVDCLLAWACDGAQGFYYARPMPEQEYRTLLRRGHVD